MQSTQDRRRDRSTQTRARLLEASARLFAEGGYEGSTLDAIAETAAVNKALIRYHFGGKQGLYSAVLRDAIRVGLDLMSAVRDSRAPAAERIGGFVDALGELTESRPHFAPMVVREWMTGGAHMEDDVMAEFIQFFEVDRQILEAGSAQGELRDVDPHSAHLALVGSLVFFQISQPVRDRKTDIPVADPGPRAYREFVKQLFLRGLAR